MSFRQQLREVLAAAWALFKRRPLLGTLPALVFVWIVDRERLEAWVDEAWEEVRENEALPHG